VGAGQPVHVGLPLGEHGEHPSAASRSCRLPAPLLCRWTLPSDSATIVAVTTESLRVVRDHLSEIVDRVQRQHERVVITKNGREAAVIISPDDLAELEETLSVLSDPEALADIREADEAYARGDVVRGVDAVRRLWR
jgi:antitoxin YefM